MEENRRTLVVYILFIIAVISLTNASVKWKPNMRSFTHSIKQAACIVNQEVSLFEYTQGPGVITEQWFTGKGCINQDTIVRYYIDGEEKASIEVNLYMAHGIGYVQPVLEDLDDRSVPSPSAKSMGTKPKKIKQQETMRLKMKRDTKESSRSSPNQRRNFQDALGVESKKSHKRDQHNSRKRGAHHRHKSHTQTHHGKRTNIPIEDFVRLGNPLDTLLSREGDIEESTQYKTREQNEDLKKRDENIEPNDDDNELFTRSEPDEQDRDSSIPWGTRRMGHLARNGGIYNTFRIPFQKSIFVSLQSKRHGHLWYNVRGVENYPIIIGDLELPAEARLRVYKQENATVQPFEYIFLAMSKNRSGLLYQLTLSTESKNFYHQEACFRVIIDNEEQIQYLSSGTEDLFLSAYYYNGGIFHGEHSGLSFKEDPGRVCAYKFFEDDPVLFNSAFSLIWRCGELVDNQCFKVRQKTCLRKYGRKECVTAEDYEAVSTMNDANKKHTQKTLINSYVWTYEW